MAMDQPISIDGTETVCTGIGDEAQADPRWKAYPIRVEFSNNPPQYLSGAHVTLNDGRARPWPRWSAPAHGCCSSYRRSYAIDATLLWQKNRHQERHRRCARHGPEAGRGAV